jgi:host factor-I protein
MDKPAAQNIQDAFLNSARRDKLPVQINLMSGSALSGRIKSFDKFSLLLDTGGHDFLIFKHAISTISLEKRG